MHLLECTCSNHVHQSSSRSWRWLCIECGVRVLVRRSVHPVPESLSLLSWLWQSQFTKALAFERPKVAGFPGEFYIIGVLNFRQ